MHIFHKWKVVHRFDLDNKRGWFEHRTCKVCGEQKMVHHLNFFSSISDAIDLGIAQGIYRAFHRRENVK